MRIFNFIKLFMNNNNKGFQFSFFWLILNHYNIEVTEKYTELVQFANSIFILSVIAFLAIINVFFTVYVLNFIKGTNYEERLKNWPLFIKIIKFYTKTSKWGLIIEGLFALISVLSIILLSFMILIVFIV